MKYSVTFTVAPEHEHNEKILRREACQTLAKQQVSVNYDEITSFVFRKKSIDARRGKVKLCLRYDVYTNGDVPESDAEKQTFTPSWRAVDKAKRVIIIGNGPAGLFAALTLLEHGITPIIIERGPETAQRKHDIADISRAGRVNGDSNYCFGEGGAGTFSDGKLYSRSNKRGDISRILALFNYHGADAKILTDAHPHIGSDKLPVIIHNINDTIKKYGGEVHFSTRCTGFVTNQKNSLCITGITTVNTETGKSDTITADAVILACGHSAPDMYTMTAALAPNALEAKTFAIGVRVEHPRTVIDGIQYRRSTINGDTTTLPAAEYRLTSQVDERGVYSFCMCPGGLVVPSASCEESIVVNGMSPSDRSGKWSNAAIVTEIRPEDIPEKYNSFGALAGLRFREDIERNMFQAAQQCGPSSLNPQTAPAQLLTDFIDGKLSTTLPKTSYTPGLASVRLDTVLPTFIVARLKKAFAEFNKNMRGYICPDALLIAPETRTSTPVRIVRDDITRESPVLKNVYPAGEGSGYAGGIVSSAMDGEAVARAIISNRYEK